MSVFLLRVIPATTIPLTHPQILTYFTAHKLEIGGLVLVPLYKRKTIGAVISIEKLDSQKMAIRKADFELKSILKVISANPILNEKQITLAKWISEYYWCPLGPAVKMMIPTKIQNSKLNKFSANTSKIQNYNEKFKNNKAQQILILTPEIFTAEKILKQYNAESTTILHSGLNDKQYLENWHKIRDNEAKIIIGTRLALFAPFINLKEIIVENEHSANYKSQQTPRLHARETAIKLAELWNAKITFNSPTPSVETSWLAENKKINLQIQNSKWNKFVANNSKIQNSIIDLRQELKEGNFSIFSRKLQEKIKSALGKNRQTPHNGYAGQVILFINRRGSSTVLLCRDCGYVPKCPNCDVPFVYHLSPIQFLCHHCGHTEIPPVLCPNCLGTRIKFFGTGTQKVEIEFKKLFPDVKVARLDSDILKSVRDEKTDSLKRDLVSQKKQILEDFQNKKTQVLVGTQIIFNKNLPKAPLVSLMLADILLYLPDFRSNERTFQIISQLKNLSSKNFILQTYSPENLAIQFAVKNDYQSFYQEEIKIRKELSYPPFSQLIKLACQHKSAKKAEEETKILAEKIKQQITVINKNLRSNSVLPITILGPSPAFISRVKNKYIWQIIIKSQISDLKIRNKILQIIPVDWLVDVDPLQII